MISFFFVKKFQYKKQYDYCGPEHYFSIAFFPYHYSDDHRFDICFKFKRWEYLFTWQIKPFKKRQLFFRKSPFND